MKSTSTTVTVITEGPGLADQINQHLANATTMYQRFVTKALSYKDKGITPPSNRACYMDFRSKHSQDRIKYPDYVVNSATNLYKLMVMQRQSFAMDMSIRKLYVPRPQFRQQGNYLTTSDGINLQLSGDVSQDTLANLRAFSIHKPKGNEVTLELFSR
jgi:hypothetical protein